MSVSTQGTSRCPRKRMLLANLRMLLKFHGLPLSGGPLAVTSIEPDLCLAQVCLPLAGPSPRCHRNQRSWSWQDRLAGP